MSFKRAHRIAGLLGLPANIAFGSKDVSWQIAPDDSAMSARIEIRGANVTGTLSMSYMGRVVTMVRIIYDENGERSEGLLFKDSMEKAVRCFNEHIQSMMHGPVQVSFDKQKQRVA